MPSIDIYLGLKSYWYLSHHLFFFYSASTTESEDGKDGGSVKTDDESSSSSDVTEGQENFSIDIHNKSSSKSNGPPLLSYSRINSQTTLNTTKAQSEGGYISRAQDGLYVRVRIPFSMQDFTVKFVYGLYTSIEGQWEERKGRG